MTKTKTSGIEIRVSSLIFSLSQYYNITPNFDIVTTSAGTVLFKLARINVKHSKEIIEYNTNETLNTKADSCYFIKPNCLCWNEAKLYKPIFLIQFWGGPANKKLSGWADIKFSIFKADKKMRWRMIWFIWGGGWVYIKFEVGW